MKSAAVLSVMHRTDAHMVLEKEQHHMGRDALADPVGQEVEVR